ncbi:60 kDa jasmonate-induced protein-like [Phoenix dactylifera]|uniref:rRNA N-glycosylase n=1 Tax=Phoenix dactylifera TaxID=42345 RepID=A0A8B8ZGW3_PHODC|nr:60 kDa jasmonate-induced protein-like [Phoenix dactylifera]
MAEFTEEFHVEAKSNGWATYRQLIERLRRRLEATRSHDRPVLPAQENPPTRWFDLVLRTYSHEITLRIRRGNLYLDAYRMENSNRWLEFGRDPAPHLIPGSSFLGFGGEYNDLENAAGQRREAINLGQQQLTTAVNLLATSTVRRERARSLIIVIQMICESVRFIRISDHLLDTYRDGSPAPNWMQNLVHGWGDLSEELLRQDADAEHRFRLSQPNRMAIYNALEATAQIGILLRPCLGPRRIPRMPRDDGPVRLPQGRPLVEVFFVRIDNIDDEDPGELYGWITVADGLRTQYICNRARDNYESIRPGQFALLTGPDRAISALGSFTIDVDLKDRDADPSPDDEVSRGQISWNAYDTTNEYDKALLSRVDGKYGSITVKYAVLSDAVAAILEVTLIDGDGEDPAEVYGGLAALNGLGESELFRKGSDDYIEVRPGQRIPLLRSIVAVPLNSSLTVRALLYDHDTVSHDDEIANGTAKFPVQLSGTSQEYISGKNGKIRVRVTWTMDI